MKYLFTRKIFLDRYCNYSNCDSFKTVNIQKDLFFYFDGWICQNVAIITFTIIIHPIAVKI